MGWESHRGTGTGTGTGGVMCLSSKNAIQYSHYKTLSHSLLSGKCLRSSFYCLRIRITEKVYQDIASCIAPSIIEM
jgi:hypothetical protein